MKPGDLVRLVRKNTPYEAQQEGWEENSERWYTIQPGEVGMLVEPIGPIFGLFLFGTARMMAHMEVFEVIDEAR